MTTKHDKTFQGMSLASLNALKPSIVARLSEFKAAENVEQTFTYTRLLEDLERAIAKELKL